LPLQQSFVDEITVELREKKENKEKDDAEDEERFIR
jgi:hypothetical protein